MDKVDKILIDIREEFELLSSQVKPTTPELFVVNIPMRTIFANKEWIEEMSQEMPVYIMCKSGNRSSKVKEMYFAENPGVISLRGGINEIEGGNILDDKIIVIHGTGGLGSQQYIQLAFLIFLVIVLGLFYFNVNKNYIIALLAIFILFIGYQILTKGCLISSLIPLPKFTLA